MKSSSVFAIAAIAMLILGLVMANVTNAPRLLIPGKTASIAFPAESQYYLLGAVFCVIALIEANFLVGLSKVMVEWHCWLSIGSALLVAFGMGMWSLSMYRSTDLQRFQLAILVPLIIGIPVFLLAQAWFGVDLVRALMKTRT